MLDQVRVYTLLLGQVVVGPHIHPRATPPRQRSGGIVLCSEIREEYLMETIRVEKRSQMVIPVGLRRRLGLYEGDLLSADVDDKGRLILQKVPTDPLERLRQSGAGLYSGRDGAAEQRSPRGQWDER